MLLLGKSVSRGTYSIIEDAIEEGCLASAQKSGKDGYRQTRVRLYSGSLEFVSKCLIRNFR